jgi:hypothetical protein
MITSLDKRINEYFSADLSAEHEDSLLISQAALAGGYAHILGSTKETKEQTDTFRGELVVKNEYSEYNLEAHFRCLLFKRFGEIAETVMASIRGTGYCSNTYAAAVILYYEIDFVRHASRF